MPDKLPDLNAVKPTVIPAVPEKTFPNHWLQKLHIEGRPESKVRLYAELKPFDRDTGECSPEATPDVVVLELGDLFGLIDPEVNPELSANTRVGIQQAIYAVLLAARAIGVDQGKVTP